MAILFTTTHIPILLVLPNRLLQALWVKVHLLIHPIRIHPPSLVSPMLSVSVWKVIIHLSISLPSGFLCISINPLLLFARSL